MELPLVGKWIFGGPVQGAYDLAKGEIEIIYHKWQDRGDVYDRLVRSGIPANALLTGNPTYQGLNNDQKAAVEAILLSRPEDLTQALVGLPGPVGNMLIEAHHAYAGDGTPANPELTPKQKAKVDAYLLFHGTPKVAPANNAWAKARVERLQPGSKAYEALHPDVRDLVIDRNRREEKIQNGKRELLLTIPQLVRSVPFAGDMIYNYIKDSIGPRKRMFDPDRIDNSVEIVTGTEAWKETAWKIDQLMQGVQDQLQKIEDGTGTVDNPGEFYRLGTFMGQGFGELLRRKIGNMVGDVNLQAEQLDVSLKKMCKMCEWYKAYLREHMWYMSQSGKHDYESIFKQVLGMFLGKMVNESSENEPIVPGRYVDYPTWKKNEALPVTTRIPGDVGAPPGGGGGSHGGGSDEASVRSRGGSDNFVRRGSTRSPLPFRRSHSIPVTYRDGSSSLQPSHSFDGAGWREELRDRLFGTDLHSAPPTPRGGLPQPFGSSSGDGEGYRDQGQGDGGVGDGRGESQHPGIQVTEPTPIQSPIQSRFPSRHVSSEEQE